MRKYHIYYVIALVIVALAATALYSILDVWIGEERGKSAIWAVIVATLIFPVVGVGFLVNFAMIAVMEENDRSQRVSTPDKPQPEAVPSNISVHNHIPFEPSQPGWTDWAIVGLLVVITLGVYRKKR